MTYLLDGITKKSFEDLTYFDQGILLNAFYDRKSKKAYDFLAGKQLGSTDTAIDYWAGPMLPTSHAEYTRMVDALKSSFTSRNMIAEVCERMVDGILGNEVKWMVDGATDTKMVEEALTKWFDKRRLNTLLWKFGVQMVALGRSTLRFVIPPRFREKDGSLPSFKTLDEALNAIHVLLPSNFNSSVIVDDYTLDTIGINIYQYMNKNELEITYVDDAGLTVLKIMSQEGTEEIRLDLGGKLWHIQGQVNKELVTDDMIQQQSALNVALTMMQRNTHYAGFTERYGIGINAYNEDGTPIKPVTGPGAVNFYQPSAYEEVITEADGSTKITSKSLPASYGRFEPSSVEAMKVAADTAEAAILSIARQSFVMMNDQQYASGRSREVAAGDFLNIEERIAREIEGVYRDMLEFALNLAGVMMNNQSFLEARVVAEARVTAFAATTDERRVNLEEYGAKLISREKAMSRAGIDDVDAELARLELEMSQMDFSTVNNPQGMDQQTNRNDQVSTMPVDQQKK